MEDKIQSSFDYRLLNNTQPESSFSSELASKISETLAKRKSDLDFIFQRQIQDYADKKGVKFNDALMAVKNIKVEFFD